MSAYVVETTALRENIRTLRSMLAPQTVFWAVVKGDGYGLGAEPLCRTRRGCWSSWYSWGPS